MHTPCMGYLRQLGLGEAGLAHLRGLAYGDVALGQRPLRERLGGPILADLAVWSVNLPGTLVPDAADPLPPAAPGLPFHSPTAFIKTGEGSFLTILQNTRSRINEFWPMSSIKNREELWSK